MPTIREIAIHAGFMKDFQALQPNVRKQVAASVAKFRTNDLPGTHVEKIHKASNPRFRSVRVTQSIRAIVLAPTTGTLHVLLKVLPHDDAYKWAERTQLRVSGNHKFGLLDVEALDHAVSKVRASPDATRLFAAVADEDMTMLGISEDVLALARELRSVLQLDDAKDAVPADQWDVLHALAAGLTPQEIIDELSLEPVNPEPVAAALDLDTVHDHAIDHAIANTREQIHTIAGDEDLHRMLNEPFDDWLVYLHPSQQHFVDAEFNGPARITGGPGTGKTVVAMHRAKKLAERNDGQVLFATYNGALAMEVGRNLDRLITDRSVRERIIVSTIDGVARQIVDGHSGRLPSFTSPAEYRRSHSTSAAFFPRVDSIWREVLTRHNVIYPVSFLNEEWEHVILPQNIRSEDAYLAASRRGRGRPLPGPQRRLIWPVLNDFRATLLAHEWWTFATLPYGAAKYAQNGIDPTYRYIVVDEVQDFSLGHLKLLKSLITNDDHDSLFLSGDSGQKIYTHGGSMSRAGINIIGRSRKLTLNHRSSVEILSLANAILGSPNAREDVEDGNDTRAARAVFHERKPIARSCATEMEELDHITETIQLWRDIDEIDFSEIAVSVRTVKRIAGFKAALKKRGIPTRQLSSSKKESRDAGVGVGTMHSLKGLEFRRMIVSGVGVDQVPPAGSITPTTEDPTTHALQMAMERQLLYVACTRAREELLVTWVGEPSTLLPPWFTGG